MQFEPLTHISKILWRFYGSSEALNPTKGLEDIQHYIKDNKVIFKPWYGAKNDERFYTRQVYTPLVKSKDSMSWNGENISVEDEEDLVYSKEHKAVCFCDIPINHLALHMRKYNSIGVGVDRTKLAMMSADLQPVRYHYIKKPDDYTESVAGLYAIEEDKGTKVIKPEKYIKIPTLFDTQRVPTEIVSGLNSHPESFDSIYEEREWRLFKETSIDIKDISFLLLPHKGFTEEELGLLKSFFDHKVGIIYASEIFKEVGNE